MLRAALLLSPLLLAVACGSDAASPGAPTTSSITKIINVSGNLAFGNVQVGTQATRTITISNSGTAALTVTGLTGPYANAYTASWTNGVIGSGQSQFVDVFFRPPTAGTYNGTLTINGDQTSGANYISVSGTGVLTPADIEEVGDGYYICVTGLCTSFHYDITNMGTGCATNVQVITRFYGSDGNGIQLGIDVPMGSQGPLALSAYTFHPGNTTTVWNTVPFNDIRSAHTRFRAFITWNNVPCQ
jgi:hypothetical protein